MPSPAPVLQIRGLCRGEETWSDTCLRPGEWSHLPTQETAEAIELADFLLGLPGATSSAWAGEIEWFGESWPPLHQARHLALLRRAFPLVPGGGLLANITLGENILLPALARQPFLIREGEKLLATALQGQGARFQIHPRDLGILPHRVGPRRRHAAALLQAWLCHPELILCVDFCRPELGKARPLIQEGLALLRTLLPQAAWLFVGTESGLPEWAAPARPKLAPP